MLIEEINFFGILCALILLIEDMSAEIQSRTHDEIEVKMQNTK